MTGASAGQKARPGASRQGRVEMREHEMENVVDLARAFGAEEHVAFSAAHAELLFVGSLGVVVVDLRGRFLDSCWMRERPVIVGPESRVVASQRTPGGWQFLYRTADGLKNCRLENGELAETAVRPAVDVVTGAAWSPCGRYLALSLRDAGIEVVDLSDGTRKMHARVDIWDAFEPPHAHRLAGWSMGGNEIVSVITMVGVTLTMVWDAFSGNVNTVLEF